MIAPIRQHNTSQRPHVVACVAASACFALGFILIISEIVVWLMDSIWTHQRGFVPTALALAGLAALGLGAHLMDSVNLSGRESSGASVNEPCRPGDQR